MPEKEKCFIPLVGENCPEACPGRITSFSVPDEYGGEGYWIQVCPNPANLGQPDSGAVYCGNGPDVITMHIDHVPSEDEIAESVKNFDY